MYMRSCLCTDTYVYIYTVVGMQVCLCVYKGVYVGEYMLVFCVYLLVYVCKCVRMYMYACIQVCICT